MRVDSFKWLPGLIADHYRTLNVEEVKAPWAPLSKPIEECRFALVTTAGLYVKGKEPPFDLEREMREPFWGDPTFRVIPRDTQQEDIGVAHHHINSEDLLQDVNIALPVRRFLELEQRGEIGSLAPSQYSFMGYQCLPPDTSLWRDKYGPEVARRMKEEGVDAALFTPA